MNFAIWFIAFIVIGALWYVFDRVFGVALYRWWYGMTHRDALPQEISKGFIYNRNASAKFTAATLLAVLQSIQQFTSGEGSFQTELLSIFFEVPLLMLGFYFGPTFFKLWREKDELLETVDKLESGEVALGGKFKKSIVNAAANVREILHSPQAPRSETGKKSGEPAQPVQAEQPLDPAALLGQYVKRDEERKQ